MILKRQFIYWFSVFILFFSPLALSVESTPSFEIPECVNFQPQEALLFPQGFLKGCALSSFQNGGHLNGSQSNWSDWENKKIRINAQHLRLIPGPTIAKNHHIGCSNDFYTHAFEDIQLLKDMGCNALRFSIEWADLEPQEGEFNYELLAFYRSFCEALVANGITPMITLYHFVHPLWFHKKGGFEKAQNIHYFIDFAKKVFSELYDIVPLWCTINEPTVLSACGYVLGIHPPGKVGHLRKAGMVLANLLQAHVILYYELKKISGTTAVSIGFAHQMLLFDAYQHTTNVPLLGRINWKDPLSPYLAQGMSYIFGHDIVMNFFKTGRFEYKIGKKKKVIITMPEAVNSFDFFGLNFYSEVTVAPHPTCYPHETMTELDYPIRPQKMYEALKEVSVFNKPIYITENGLADSKDAHRAEFIKSYVQAMHQALQEGCDVRGYYHWTLADNFEWSEGYTKKFGLYSVDFNDPARSRTPRPSSLVYRDFMHVA